MAKSKFEAVQPYPPYDALDATTVELARQLFERIGMSSDVDYMAPFRLVHYLEYLEGNAEPVHLTKFPYVGEGTRDMIVVPAIPFWSACSHHALPFFGHVAVGYVPNKWVLGLSKLPLLVRTLARGYWLQEDLAIAIADRIEGIVWPIGTAVHINARHTCQMLDIGQPPVPPMLWTVRRGCMSKPSRMAEFYSMIGANR